MWPPSRNFGGMTSRKPDAIKKTAAGMLKLLYPNMDPLQGGPRKSPLPGCLRSRNMRKRKSSITGLMSPKNRLSEFPLSGAQSHMLMLCYGLAV